MRFVLPLVALCAFSSAPLKADMFDIGSFGLVPALSADPPYPTTNALSLVANGATRTTLSNGNLLWVASLTWTNFGPTDLSNVYFVNLLEQTNLVDDTWNNTDSTWSDTMGDTAMAFNQAFNLLLDPSLTNISPASFGLSATDSLPAFLISPDLAAGASVTTDVDFETSPGVFELSIGGAAVGSPVPEPTVFLLVTVIIFVGVLARRRKPAASR